MDPAGASSSTNPGEPTFDEAQKRALLSEYDESDYKGRYALLDREQITVRQISRWRREVRSNALRGATLRVADPSPEDRSTPGLAAESAALTSVAPLPAVVTEGPDAPVVPAPPGRPTPSEPGSTAKRRRWAGTGSAKVPAATPSLPAAAPSPSPATPTPATPPPSRATPASASADAGTASRSHDAPGSTSAAADSAPRPQVYDAIPRAASRRRPAAAAAASTLRDAADVHLDQIVHHAESLERMLADAARARVSPSSEIESLIRRIADAREAAETVREAMRAESIAVSTTTLGADGRRRRPWWTPEATATVTPKER